MTLARAHKLGPIRVDRNPAWGHSSEVTRAAGNWHLDPDLSVSTMASALISPCSRNRCGGFPNQGSKAPACSASGSSSMTAINSSPVEHRPIWLGPLEAAKPYRGGRRARIAQQASSQVVDLSSTGIGWSLRHGPTHRGTASMGGDVCPFTLQEWERERQLRAGRGWPFQLGASKPAPID
jgi:hypothetical protein